MLHDLSTQVKNEDVNTVSMVFKRIEQIQQAVRNNSEKAIDRANLGKLTSRDVWTTIMVHEVNSAHSSVTLFIFFTGMFIREVDYVWPLAVKVSFIADLLSYHDTIGESKGKKTLVFLKHFLMGEGSCTFPRNRLNQSSPY